MGHALYIAKLMQRIMYDQYVASNGTVSAKK